MMMLPSECAHPVSVSSADAEGRLAFEHRVVGGFSRREHLAIQLFQGLLSNAVFVQGSTADKLREIALQQAERLEEDFKRLNAPPVTPLKVIHAAEGPAPFPEEADSIL